MRRNARSSGCCRWSAKTSNSGSSQTAFPTARRTRPGWTKNGEGRRRRPTRNPLGGSGSPNQGLALVEGLSLRQIQQELFKVLDAGRVGDTRRVVVGGENVEDQPGNHPAVAPGTLPRRPSEAAKEIINANRNVGLPPDAVDGVRKTRGRPAPGQSPQPPHRPVTHWGGILPAPLCPWRTGNPRRPRPPAEVQSGP